MLILTDNFLFVSFFVFLLLDFLLFGVILKLLGPYRAIFGQGVGPEKFFGVYSLRLITFIFFLFSDYFIFRLFGDILSLLGPYPANFGVGVGSENFFGLYVYRLTTFVF